MTENTWSIYKVIGRVRRTINDGIKNARVGQPLASEYQRLAPDHNCPVADDDEATTIAPDNGRGKAEEAGLDNIQNPRPFRRRSLARFWLLFSASVATVLLILTAVATILQSQPQGPKTATTTGLQKPAKLGLHCGRSLAEAKAQGCEFDLLSYSWTPSRCYERDTDLEFREWVHRPERQFGPFPFFIDQNATAHITDEESLSFRAAPGSLAHTSQEEHLGHCIFWMRRIERILEGKGRFTERGDGVPHALHCTKSLLARLEGENPKDRNELHAVIGVGFNTC
ncbi:uncharacterized protein Z520_00651 [Fonsecaea multimorphosa CBS 102226]|uniref:Uncharacterized protein n=1 Tax=Fonsecaea multimorphosa CBS 102226 TaxID=1442371 RepID=A0A0D2L4I5_9EURO|nr:uncharacterized protein Z520_00651 [Fonsecaea multimorphosa CBS 102226]KIY03959.1 hypothetical protein Z520_00651 [Fonsecaea multimorphosa CBS 102226]OAL31799.1 hypothetical protein AYO22_00669 [Fonsecaea multimorphosa]